MNGFATLLLLFLAMLLTSCAAPGGYYGGDGPPGGRDTVSLADIPEPVPRVESLSASGNKPYVVSGQTYIPMRDARGYRARGHASWYGRKFHGRRTSSGEPYDMYAFTAAHKTLPIPCYARVRNLANDRSLIVRVNDRGPFLYDRLIDLSYAAAMRLGVVGTGTAWVEVTALDTAEPPPPAVAALPPAESDAPRERLSGPKTWIQLGAFSEMVNAERLAEWAAEHGLPPAHIGVTATGEGGALHRVRIGPVRDEAELERIRTTLREAGQPYSLVWAD